MPPTHTAGARRGAGAPAAGGAGLLRRLNLDRVLGVLMDAPGPVTRGHLIEATGLSTPTVSSLVAQLEASGLAQDLGTGPSRGGRRPSFLEFNARHGFVLGMDLGPTKTRLALADLRGEVIAQSVEPTPSAPSPERVLAALCAAVERLLAAGKVPRRRVLAIGAGAPGAVDRDRGVVVLSSNLGWADVAMAAPLERALGAPVVLENDVNLALLGERWRGAARGHDTYAFISTGTGIGAGILVEGALHRGHHSLAGEIGLMCMGPQFLETQQKGGLESLAGLRALTARWTPAGGAHPERWVAELCEAAASGDDRAAAVLDEAAQLIGIAVANLCVVLDPSLIVLGGALATQGAAIVERVRRVVARVVPVETSIVVSHLGKDAPLLGCLLVAMARARDELRRQLVGTLAATR